MTTKIEAEDFDIPGKGRNEDGTNNASYSAGGSCDGTWNTTYREGTTVSIGEKNGGLVIGCNPTGNYFEYTIKVPATGEMVVKATVAANGEGALVFKIGDKVVSDTLTYTGDSWDKFGTTRGTIKFDAKGEQILTLEVAKGYIDIDNFEFVLTDCAPGDASCGGPSIDCDAHPDADACQPLINVAQPQMQKLQHYTVFDIRGTLIGGVSGYTIDDAISYLTLVPGLYIIKSDKEIKKFVK